MIFLTALGKFETTVWPWSLLDHGNSFVMGIVEIDWAISPLFLSFMWLSKCLNLNTVPILESPSSSVVRVIDTDIYLRHSWHPSCVTCNNVTSPRVLTNTDKMTPDTQEEQHSNEQQRVCCCLRQDALISDLQREQPLSVTCNEIKSSDSRGQTLIIWRAGESRWASPWSVTTGTDIRRRYGRIETWNWHQPRD